MRPVVWSIDAHRDNLDILRYIAEDDPVAAERIVNAIETTGKKLGAYVTGRPGRVTGTYEKSVARYPFIIVYALKDIESRECVVILRVIHTSRNWPSEEWPQP